jgi:glycosyltransferase involved in cell wall biosynthesis
LNILIIIESSGIGGLEVHTASLASSLKSMGCGVRVIIFTCDFVNDEMRSTIAAFFDGKGIDSVAMPKCDIWKGAAYLADIIEEQNIDILHSHTAYTAEICDLLARRYKKAYVQTIHGKYPFDPAGDPCRYAGHIIFISEELKDYHAGELLKEERPASVIPNGVEITRPVSGSINRADAYDEKNLSFADTSAAKERIKANDFNKNGIEPFILVFASRIDPDYIESIERFAAGVVEAYKADRRIRAEIYGAGSEGEAVKEIIERSNASAGREILLFKGFSDRIMERFAEGDVVIGVGRIILEAMAVGRPALVLGRWGYGSYINEGNADELVKFNFTGRDVQKAYDPVEFAADICFLANDRDTYSRLSEFGRNFVMEGYSQASVTSRGVRGNRGLHIFLRL